MNMNAKIGVNACRDNAGLEAESLALQGAIQNRRATELLSYGLALETAAAERYKELAGALAAEDDVSIVKDIFLDDIKHKRLLEELCLQLAGAKPDVSGFATSFNPSKLRETLPDVLYGRAQEELSSAQFYRQLMSSLSCVEHRDAVFEILVNKQSHAQQMSLLYVKHTRP